MILKPLADRVIVKMTELDEHPHSGIILSTNSKEKPYVAEIIEIGPDILIDETNSCASISVGDKIIFDKFSGFEVKVNNENFIIVNLSDILAIVK